MKMSQENYSMLFDFYEMTMANGYFHTDYKDKICYFDLFYRSNPDKGGYAICCGLESIIDFVEKLHFFTFFEQFFSFFLRFSVDFTTI